MGSLFPAEKPEIQKKVKVLRLWYWQTHVEEVIKFAIWNFFFFEKHFQCVLTFMVL